MYAELKLYKLQVQIMCHNYAGQVNYKLIMLIM
jgi:hypothetical protein